MWLTWPRSLAPWSTTGLDPSPEARIRIACAALGIRASSLGSARMGRGAAGLSLRSCPVLACYRGGCPCASHHSLICARSRAGAGACRLQIRECPRGEGGPGREREGGGVGWDPAGRSRPCTRTHRRGPLGRHRVAKEFLSGGGTSTRALRLQVGSRPRRRCSPRCSRPVLATGCLPRPGFLRQGIRCTTGKRRAANAHVRKFPRKS